MSNGSRRYGDFSRTLQPDLDVLGAEIAMEKASALARSGRKVEQALAALQAVPVDAATRSALALQAAEAVQGYFVQRELMGFRSHADIIERLPIPREVLTKIGVRIG